MIIQHKVTGERHEVLCKMDWSAFSPHQFLYLIEYEKGGAGSIYHDKVLYLKQGFDTSQNLGRSFKWRTSREYEEVDFASNFQAKHLLKEATDA